MISRTGLFFAMLVSMAVVMPAQADKLDDIIASGKLRCAVVLDFPPMGSRDEKNQPIGYDVDTCNDLAAALGVKPEYVETPFPDRIPALVSGRADVGVASTSDTLKRAQTIGFWIPYFAFKMVVLTKKGIRIDSYASLKGRKTGSVSGTFEAIALEKDVKKWNDPKGSFRAYQTQANVFLALAQGQIEATVAVRPDFELTPDNIQTIAAICAHLDGLPLVIELIAARMRLMSPQALLERLSANFGLTADGMRAPSERQKTLRNAIDWSYKLLSAEEQKLFMYLSVFSGGFTLTDTEAIFARSFTEKSVPELLALASG